MPDSGNRTPEEEAALDKKIERTIKAHEITRRAGVIVGEEVFRVIENSITAGADAAMKELREFPEMDGINFEKAEAILRRTICEHLVLEYTRAAEGWDDILFHGNSRPRFV